MQFKSLISKIGIGSAIVAVSVLFMDCSNKITEEQLAQLKELRKQERSLTAKISDIKSDKAAVEKELNARKAEMKKCQEDTEFVKKKLSQWPNVWPDWKPEQEAAPETE